MSNQVDEQPPRCVNHCEHDPSWMQAGRCVVVIPNKETSPQARAVTICGHRCGSQPVKCPDCNRTLETRDGSIPIHAKTADEELRKVNPKACTGSWHKVPAPPSPIPTAGEQRGCQDCGHDANVVSDGLCRFWMPPVKKGEGGHYCGHRCPGDRTTDAQRLRCHACGHQSHPAGKCLNMASDNGCACTFGEPLPVTTDAVAGEGAGGQDSGRIITAYGELTVPEDVEKAIVTPHDHETPSNRPLWIVWRHTIGRDGLSDGPEIDSICDSERSVRYHVAMMLERVEGSRQGGDHGDFLFHVERVPANHNFGFTDLKAFERFKETGKRRENMRKFRGEPYDG